MVNNRNVNTRVLENKLSSIYYNVRSPAGYGSAQSLHKSMHPQGHKVSMNFVKQSLQRQLTHQLHKQRRINFKRRKTITPGPNHQMQIDLIDMSPISNLMTNINSYLMQLIVFQDMHILYQ